MDTIAKVVSVVGGVTGLLILGGGFVMLASAVIYGVTGKDLLGVTDPCVLKGEAKPNKFKMAP